MLGVSSLGQGQRERHVEHKAKDNLEAVGSWCFKPGQSQRLIPGLKETLMERDIVERSNKAEIKTGRTE